jgi:alpha-glucosidase (family GH31 glycosyl hydrolase)
VLLTSGSVACTVSTESPGQDETDDSSESSDGEDTDSSDDASTDESEDSSTQSDDTDASSSNESSNEDTSSDSSADSSGESSDSDEESSDEESSDDPGDPELHDDWEDDDALDQTPNESDDDAEPCEASSELEIEDDHYTFIEGAKKTRVIFYRSDIFRIWQAPTGNFEDPATDDIVVSLDFPAAESKCTDKGDYYRIKTKDAVLRVYKDPIRFELYRRDNKTLVFAESEPIARDGSSTVQSLKRGEDEQFFGGGMQNGRFSHRDKTIGISNDLDWSDGGNPNPAPFYLSSAGYGVYRNTWSDGSYTFTSPVESSHKEDRFDAFYFYGPTSKGILRRYTDLTGRPFMPAIWALQSGDANCYNKDGATTADVLEIAQGYIDNDLPTGWILPNDGYGCGYTDLPNVVSDLHDKGFYTGLWTENDLDKIAWEVGTAGTRVVKTDVAWVGSGYQFALNAVKDAAKGIEDNSDSRRFIWTVCGWAGTHRYAVMWTGDESGSWNYIRFHIPTVHGSSFSAQNYTTGDIDGIFGGSAKTYVRDLQWKAMTPVLMSMSGWAASDKQPWRYGEPYTTINRKYMDLKVRLMPYMYSLAALAHHTATPTIRSLVMEYPSDPKTWDDTTKYEFLVGESFLVAPVYEDSETRDGIYLPKGDWIDYWDGTVIEGPKTLDGYDAPLEKLPLFVRRGAIVPMWPPMKTVLEKPRDPLTLDVYPLDALDPSTSGFRFYEDDGLTRKHEDGEYALQVMVQRWESDELVVRLGKLDGEFAGKLSERTYELTIHHGEEVSGASVDGEALEHVDDLAALEKAASGWTYVADDRQGIVYVKTGALDTDANHVVRMQK